MSALISGKGASHIESFLPRFFTKKREKGSYMNKIWPKQLRVIFFFLFAAVFTGIVITNCRNNSIWILPAAVLIMGVLTLFNRLSRKWEEPRRYYLVLAVFCVVLAAVQITLSVSLRYTPMYDIEAIYQNARLWAETGTFGQYSSETSAAGYLYYYPNNLGGTALLMVVFQACRLLGIEDTFMAASVVNSLLIVGAVCVTSLCAKRLWGVKQALTVLLVYALSLPFYFAAPVFYTDFLSILFPVLAFYLFVRQQQDKTIPPVLYWAAVGLAAAVGMLVKFTVVIILLACLIWLLCSKQWKQAGLFTVVTGLTVIVVLYFFHSYIYANHLDRERANQQNMPYSHWIMMGLSETGTYNEPDLKFARFIADPAERVKAINGAIKKRAEQLGGEGIMALYWEKGARVFGDGTFELDHFLQYDPAEKNTLHTFLLQGDQNYPAYQFLCGSVFLAVLLLCLIYAWYAFLTILRGRKRIKGCMVPQMCMFGLLLFLMMWEANSRYIINFLPMVYLSAIPGIQVLSELICRRR